MELHEPPIPLNADGKPRLVGFEFEYAGLPLVQAAKVLALHFDGEIREETRNNFTIETSRYGTFHLELDVGWVKKLSQEVADAEAESLEGTALAALERISTALVSVLMPYEIISPPLPIALIPTFDKLCCELRAHGAEGTSASPFYAFGTHINIDMPKVEPRELSRYLAAFFLLQDILKETYKPMDTARRLSPFVDPYPDSYGEVVLAPGYAPDFTQLVDDYLAHNPTRNRALDMLPLFASYNEPRLRAVVGEKEKINPRRAFHYRLPNCHLDQPDWSVVAEWNRWVAIERLAEDPQRLRQMGDAWLRRDDSWRELAERRVARAEG